jgi:predicted O-methyltransferase YrrM
MTQTTRERTYRDIRGWFSRTDYRLFTGLLEAQSATPPGDLVEIGAFLGKSAVVIGNHLRPGERFVVIDLFGDMSLLGDSAIDDANRSENEKSYRRLTREHFEANYLSLHDELPVVVQAPSDQIMAHVEPGAVRFVHVDASHLYEPVAEDCRSVKKMLRPGGVAAFDDWRNAKCPGVAAAIWESVISDGLVPVAVSHNKLYAAHEGADDVLAAIREITATDADWWRVTEHQIMGHTVLGVDNVQAARRRREEKAAMRRPRAAARTAQPKPQPPSGVRSLLGKARRRVLGGRG